jgi:hypothetical protein
LGSECIEIQDSDDDDDDDFKTPSGFTSKVIEARTLDTGSGITLKVTPDDTPVTLVTTSDYLNQDNIFTPFATVDAPLSTAREEKV